MNFTLVHLISYVLKMENFPLIVIFIFSQKSKPVIDLITKKEVRKNVAFRFYTVNATLKGSISALSQVTYGPAL